MRLQYTLVFLLLTTLTYGQKSTLLQNVNVRAKELKHNLNEAGDSIVFKCERTIYEIMIFNDDFERVFKVKDSDAIVSIADLPVGRYIVEALLSDKLIVITLLRNESFDLPETAPLITDNTNLFGKKVTAPKVELASAEKAIEAPKKVVEKKPIEEKVAVVTKTAPEEDLFGNESNTNKMALRLPAKKATPVAAAPIPKKKETITEKQTPMTSSLSLFKSSGNETKVTPKTSSEPEPDIEIARANRIESTYWIVYTMNNGQVSEKILKMGDQETVDRMIKKIEIDMKTRSGRLNELTIWTVYDPAKFVQHKRVNKDNYMDVKSESFNMLPYYKTEAIPEEL